MFPRGVPAACHVAQIVLRDKRHNDAPGYGDAFRMQFRHGHLYRSRTDRLRKLQHILSNILSGSPFISELFGGTVFPLAMGYAADAIGQNGAVAVMTAGVIYLLIYTFKIRKFK